ncbi:MAG: DNA adenine methylase [Desulfobulbaceae bacterium]|jgi:DNA adenine methylase|nr:DNA adenine methylase [Desulfobulbaceae bacterium]
MTTPTRPMVRYHGGKWRLSPWIQSFFPPHRIYCEPFCGAASVLLSKPRAYAEYLNDLDGEIINLFRVLQDDTQAKELIRLLSVTPFARDEFNLAQEKSLDPVERARRLCITSFMGFSSGAATGYKTGFRSRSFRCYTSPAHDWMNYPESLLAVIERLRGVTIENRSAFDIIPLLDTPDTLFYIDPPYPASTRTSYGAYRHEITDADHEALAACLRACSGYVVISGYRCNLYDRLFNGWTRMEKQTRTDSGYSQECLWLSPRTAACSRNKQLSLLELFRATSTEAPCDA